MNLKIIPIFLLVFGICFYASSSALAITPDEYCKIHEDSKAPGTCAPRGDCAVLTTNLGTEECKKCTEGGCEMTDCANCPKEE